jgi:leucyl aminopeptidase
MNNVSPNAFAGSMVGALFLRRFVSSARVFAHFDIYGWNPKARPTCAVGGEAHAIRALYRYLSRRYG